MKYIFSFILFFSVIFTPIVSSAEPARAWEIETIEPANDSTYEVRAKKIAKMSPANDPIYKKSKIKIPSPKVPKMARYLKKGFGVATVLQVGIDLLDTGVKYVMNPENNTVRFTNPTVTSEPMCRPYSGSESGTKEEVCSLLKDRFNKNFDTTRFTLNGISFNENTGVGRCNLSLGTNDYTQFFKCAIPKSKEIEIPLDDLADRVKKLEQKDDNNAREFVKQIIRHEIQEGVYNNMLDDNAEPLPDTDPQTNPQTDPATDPQTNPQTDPATDPQTNPQTDPATDPQTNPQTDPATDPQTNPQTDPKTDEKTDSEEVPKADKFKLPKFCDWAKKVCDFVDWMKKKPKDEDYKTDIKDRDLGEFLPKMNKQYVKGDRQCPAPKEIPITLVGQSKVISISYEPFCEYAKMIRPAVILGAYISALLIISGGRSRE